MQSVVDMNVFASDERCVISSQRSIWLHNFLWIPTRPSGWVFLSVRWSRHILHRCSPSVDVPELQKFDDLSNITNNTLSDSQWRQASLLMRFGGLGVKKLSSLALPAFLASATSTLLLQGETLGGSVRLSDELGETLENWWTALYGQVPTDQSASKQSVWDKPGLLAQSAAVEETRNSPFQRASLLTACAPYSVDWLLALPIIACGLRPDNEAVRIAVELRLGSELDSPHSCRCGNMVDANGIHGLVSKHVPSSVVRHHALNDCVSRAFSAAGIRVKKEPASLVRSSGKHPDGCTLIQWHRGKHLASDVTVCAMTAASYVTAASHTAGAAADRKFTKYTELYAAWVTASNSQVTWAAHWSNCFLGEPGSKISERSHEPLETQFLFQRVSMLIQHFNSILYHETFPVGEDTDT